MFSKCSCRILVTLSIIHLDDVDLAASDSDEMSNEQIPNKKEARPQSPGMNN